MNSSEKGNRLVTLEKVEWVDGLKTVSLSLEHFSCAEPIVPPLPDTGKSRDEQHMICSHWESST